MQNIPDKGVSGASYYLEAEHTVKGLSRSLLGVNGKAGKVARRSRFGKAVLAEKSMLCFARRMWPELLPFLPGPPLE